MNSLYTCSFCRCFFKSSRFGEPVSEPGVVDHPPRGLICCSWELEPVWLSSSEGFSTHRTAAYGFVFFSRSCVTVVSVSETLKLAHLGVYHNQSYRDHIFRHSDLYVRHEPNLLTCIWMIWCIVMLAHWIIAWMSVYMNESTVPIANFPLPCGWWHQGYIFCTFSRYLSLGKIISGTESDLKDCWCRVPLKL